MKHKNRYSSTSTMPSNEEASNGLVEDIEGRISSLKAQRKELLRLLHIKSVEECATISKKNEKKRRKYESRKGFYESRLKQCKFSLLLLLFA